MKRISTAIVLTILFAAGTHARTVAELFIAAPDGIFPLMGKNTRMDMVDYSTHSLPTMSETETGGKTRIVEMDDRRLLAQAGTASSVEVAVLPMRSDTLLAVIETVLVPMADSSIRFFSTRTWQELPQKNATGMADFFQNGRIPDNPPRMLFAKISFDSESGHFVFTNTTASYYVESDAPASLPLMKNGNPALLQRKELENSQRAMIRNIEPISLVELNRRIAGALAVAPGLNRQWITAETSDLRCSAGHCYMELVQKNDTGTPLAKARAVIWASTYAGLRERFLMATGVALASDMKVMVQVNVNYHPVYGMSLVINDIDPDYTVGDLARRRNAIIMRLRAEGVFDLNRTLPWSPVPQRVAVVSARGAAGYGDFVRHLHGNAYGLRFHTELFESAMQGERTVQGIIDALEKIAARENEFDCVAIIRGGGAVSELAAFDNYDLAANVAQFPLPVIVGIGHDRDTTVLDYVAARRVKTPTAAAEFLVASLASALERVASLARSVQASVVELVGARKQQLAYYRGQIPALARAAIDRQRQKVGLPTARLIAESVKNGIARRRARLEAIDELLAALAPEATLRRGYSITRVNGHAVTDSALLAAGTTITTTFAKGNPVTSTIDGII